MKTPLEIIAFTTWYDLPVEALRFDFLQNQAELVVLFPQEADYEPCSLFFKTLFSFRSEMPEGENFVIMGIYEVSALWQVETEQYEVFFTFQVGENCVPLWQVQITCQNLQFSENWEKCLENNLVY